MECTYERITTTTTLSISGDSEAIVASRAQRHRPDGFRLTAVGERDVIDICEGCGNPILDGEDYKADDDGVRVHTVCDPEDLSLAAPSTLAISDSVRQATKDWCDAQDGKEFSRPHLVHVQSVLCHFACCVVGSNQ